MIFLHIYDIIVKVDIFRCGGIHNFLAKNEQYGSHGIILESRDASRLHIVIEFKHGEDVEKLKDKALAQIHDQKYYAGLEGDVLCIGIAHDKKVCRLTHEMIKV